MRARDKERLIAPVYRAIFEGHIQPEPNSGCWLWAGGADKWGYGTFNFRLNGKRMLAKAHRVSFHFYVGKIQPGLLILHRCDVPCCVNPTHLRAGTNDENMADMVSKKRSRNQYMRGLR